MQFCFFRASRPLVATSAFALLTSLISGPMANAQAAAQQPAAAGQAAAPQKNYKDRGEYDLYSKITQTTDPKARLELLNTWQDKYPQSDFAPDRLLYFVATLAQLAPSDPTARQKLLEKCAELLKSDPKNFRAMYLISLWGPAVGGTSPSPDLLSQVDSAAHGALDNIDAAFDASKKPANVSDTDFTKAKSQAQAVAHNALAWEAMAKKDTATAENEYKASLQANPDQGNVSAAYAKLLVDDKKVPEGLFEYARAAEYTGPGTAIDAATRQKLMDYFNKAYKDYHGSSDGADQILAQAKTDALPPAGLNVTSQADLANKEAEKINQRIASDPQFKLWYSIKQQLTGDQGDHVLQQQCKRRRDSGRSGRREELYRNGDFHRPAGQAHEGRDRSGRSHQTRHHAAVLTTAACLCPRQNQGRPNAGFFGSRRQLHQRSLYADVQGSNNSRCADSRAPEDRKEGTKALNATMQKGPRMASSGLFYL